MEVQFYEIPAKIVEHTKLLEFVELRGRHLVECLPCLCRFVIKLRMVISLGVPLGSSHCPVCGPLNVIIAWISGIPMDLGFNVIETGCLALTILVTTFALQDGTSHYLKGLVLVLLLCYIIIGACFFVVRGPLCKYLKHIKNKI